MKDNASEKILMTGGTCWYLWNFRRNVIAALTAKGFEVVVVAPSDDYSNRIAGLAGVSWVDWPLAGDGANPFQESASFLRLFRVARQARPDYVINHGIKANIYGGITCRLLSIPYANSVTGLGTVLTASSWGARVLGRLYAFGCNGARALFIQNYDDLAELRDVGLSDRVAVVRTMGSGVDVEHFAFSPMPSGRDRTFLFVGRLQHDKGISDYVEAARTVRAESPGARFIAVGSQSFTNRGAVSDKLLEEWKREGVVEFVGHHDDIRSWLENAHAIVLPSQREGMPRVILEASASGRPAIAYDVPGCREAVISGQTGYLCAPEVSALTDAMRQICRATDEDLASMGQAARADAEARFSEAKVIEATIAAVLDSFGLTIRKA